MFKNIVIAILAAGWITSLPFFYGRWDWFIVIVALVAIACVEIEDLVNDIRANRRFKRKVAKELEAAGREVQKKIG